MTPKLPIGELSVDQVGFDEAIDRIAALVAAGRGGVVFTPNVDHVVQVETDLELRAAYASCALSLADGMPLLWLARAMGRPLPAKVSGSDLLEPLCARAAMDGTTIYLLGGRDGVAETAGRILMSRHPGLGVVGCDAPPLGFDRDVTTNQAVIDRIVAQRPGLLFVALGAPKQELWLHRHKVALGATVGLGIGASLDFIAGVSKRAPRWVSSIGGEWLYRLGQEPKRMAERYLIRDRAIVGIAWRTWRQHHSWR
jgi:N-acetylglucosaminyldiphosphoundecaprenol N-acetyl-beta-D-mannosaminyltransferase